MKTEQCRWTRDRLPLLAGGELVSDERRRVERHLIGCSGCRDRHDASRSALSALHAVASFAPASQADAPSLWPALARQIREARHAPARSPWRDCLDAIRGEFVSISWPAVGLALSLGGVMTAAVTSQRVDTAPSTTLAEKVRPVELDRMVPQARELRSPSPSGALPEAPLKPIGLLTQGQVDPFQPPQGLRFEYELERGTPMEPGTRDPQHSY